MTARTTTRSIGSNRISLPRAGLGALLAGTLLTGSLLSAAAYAGINAATNGAVANKAVIVAPLPNEPAAVRNARIRAGNGPLAGDTPGVPAQPTVNRSERGVIRFGEWLNARHVEITGHAPGHGPLE
jgi:hypothetical protein